MFFFAIKIKLQIGCMQILLSNNTIEKPQLMLFIRNLNKYKTGKNWKYFFLWHPDRFLIWKKFR